MLFKIKWESKLTGATGQGTEFEEDNDPDSVISKLNKEHPNLNHWYVEK